MLEGFRWILQPAGSPPCSFQPSRSSLASMGSSWRLEAPSSTISWKASTARGSWRPEGERKDSLGSCPYLNLLTATFQPSGSPSSATYLVFPHFLPPLVWGLVLLLLSLSLRVRRRRSCASISGVAPAAARLAFRWW